ncbi:MAG: restriction endonuclease [Clostridia bacterium]|nr:restriction endonuclease [Clostridia bacterium]
MKNKKKDNKIMAKTTKKQETPVVTRAEKKDAAKNVIREILAVKPLKHNELIEEAAKLYVQRFGGDNVNDVNGRIGSVLDIMKKESDVMYEGGMYALKARLPIPAPEIVEEKAEEKPVKKATRARTKKAAETAPKTDENAAVKEEVKAEETATETPVKKARKTRAKKEEKAEPLPAAPVLPIAPVAPITPEVAPEPIPEKTGEQTEEKPAPKKRGRKPKAKVEQTPVPEQKPEKTEEKAQEKPAEVAEKKAEIKDEPKTEEKTATVQNPPAIKPKAEVAEKNVVMDMSFLFGGAKPQKPQPEKAAKPAEKPIEKPIEKPAQKMEERAAIKPIENKVLPPKAEEKRPTRVLKTVKKAVERPLTADEKLRESFLKKLRSLGGDYFEYYSVYLLERYSMKNGRRLEGLKISGGEHDGGIDGEIELTDKLGFRETIYIQAKNWNPEKGDERLWVVGETLLQQFIGACACRQAKDGKQHCRGIFITTSRFTPDAKRILNDLSDKIVGYDGEDLYEAAKECKFGLLYENGNWKLDEKLLSGTKAFFNLY